MELRLGGVGLEDLVHGCTCGEDRFLAQTLSRFLPPNAVCHDALAASHYQQLLACGAIRLPSRTDKAISTGDASCKCKTFVDDSCKRQIQLKSDMGLPGKVLMDKRSRVLRVARIICKSLLPNHACRNSGGLAAYVVSARVSERGLWNRFLQ